MIAATDVKTVRVIPWKDLPDDIRWAYSYGDERAGMYVVIDGHPYNVRNLVLARHDARHFGITGWNYAFRDATGNGCILIRPTRGNVGKWPHEWTHIEFMTIQD